MAKVKLNPEKQTLRDVEIALSKFKRSVEADGTLKTLQEKQQYTKPSVERKLKKAAAKARWRREIAKNTLPAKQY